MRHPAIRYATLGLLAALLVSTEGLASHSQSTTIQLSPAQDAASTLTICSSVKRIVLEQSGAESSQVTDGASLVDDLGMDWLDLAEFFMALEREFDISIPDEHTELINTVGDACKYVLGAVRG
ncbi:MULTISPECIES: acyl carrier protein [Myxococcus]|uniref:acyl carrier protein n=1 Tax=Myxococcus TaxID=32 RepID=UPI00112B5735|nr:acyl carrier protein [Myxococcus sp. NMCA1]